MSRAGGAQSLSVSEISDIKILGVFLKILIGRIAQIGLLRPSGSHCPNWTFNLASDTGKRVHFVATPASYKNQSARGLDAFPRPSGHSYPGCYSIRSWTAPLTPSPPPIPHQTRHSLIPSEVRSSGPKSWFSNCLDLTFVG